MNWRGPCAQRPPTWLAGLPPEVTGKLLDTVPLPAEIAAEMVVQTSTIKSHIYHLLQKLRVRDRDRSAPVSRRTRSTAGQPSLHRVVQRGLLHQSGRAAGLPETPAILPRKQ